MSKSFQYDVFLSHNSADKPRVRELAERLRSAGLRVWFDEWVIKPGDDIYLAIERGLEAARVQVLCLSPEALGPEWVKLERSTVLFRDPTNEGRRFVPLLLADCELPDTLRRYKYVDFREELEAGFDELLEACREEMEELVPESELKRALAKKKSVTQPEKSEPIALLERKLTGPREWIHSVTVSPDGIWVIAGSGSMYSRNKSIKIWNIERGEQCEILDGHTGQVNSVAITPNGKRILSASFDATICVWEKWWWTRKKEVLHGHTNAVRSVVALGDNTHALSGGDDKTLRLWDLDSGRCIKVIECGISNVADVFCVAVASAGNQVLSGHRNGDIRLWNIETSQCLAILKGHSDSVFSVQITPDGQFAVSGAEDKTVKIWWLKTGTCVGTFEGHQHEVRSALFR